MDVDTLQGKDLDDAVAAALGEPSGYEYSKSCHHAGSLLDRFRIDLHHHDDGTADAFVRLDYQRKAHATGASGAQAAMRALLKCLAISTR